VSRYLVALDIDGTLMHEDGTISPAVRAAVLRAADAGHAVMLATGRSVDATLPVAAALGIRPDFLVCSNGAITLKRDSLSPTGYVREFVETFDAGPVLEHIRGYLGDAHFAVEDASGHYRYTEQVSDTTFGTGSTQVPFEELTTQPATRVVVVSPDHDLEQFFGIVEQMGLSQVSYAIGWSAWLDIAPDGVTKATALERVRVLLDVPLNRVAAVGDGRNDLAMLEWAGESGRAAAMGQAPPEVHAAASEIIGSVEWDGLVAFLDSL
jgi:5-amino-6-(5-phospho-D-ribitylamino)uracil phosphatase